MNESTNSGVLVLSFLKLNFVSLILTETRQIAVNFVLNFKTISPITATMSNNINKMAAGLYDKKGLTS